MNSVMDNVHHTIAREREIGAIFATFGHIKVIRKLKKCTSKVHLPFYILFVKREMHFASASPVLHTVCNVGDALC